MKLSTSRLDLVPATFDHVCAELAGPESLASLLRADVGPECPPGEYDRGAQEFFRDRLKEGGAKVVGWYGWYAIRRATADQPSVVVGSGGYFGPPGENGEVEIGLSVLPAWQGMGFAGEIVGALVENALSDARVRRIVARTTPLNAAALRLLEKCGFRRADEDETSGKIRFVISRNTGE